MTLNSRSPGIHCQQASSKAVPIVVKSGASSSVPERLALLVLSMPHAVTIRYQDVDTHELPI